MHICIMTGFAAGIAILNCVVDMKYIFEFDELNTCNVQIVLYKVKQMPEYFFALINESVSLLLHQSPFYALQTKIAFAKHEQRFSILGSIFRY